MTLKKSVLFIYLFALLVNANALWHCQRWLNFDVLAVVVVPICTVFWQLLQQFAELVLAFFFSLSGVWIGAITGIQSWFHKLSLRLVWELSLPLADWPVFSASIFSGKPCNFDLTMHISGNLLPHSFCSLLFVCPHCGVFLTCWLHYYKPNVYKLQPGDTEIHRFALTKKQNTDARMSEKSQSGILL